MKGTPNKFCIGRYTPPFYISTSQGYFGGRLPNKLATFLVTRTELLERAVTAVALSSNFVMASTSGMKEISIAKRLEILEKLENGASLSDVACEYRLSERTIRRYRQNSESIRHFAANPKHLDMKRQRMSTYIDLESRLFNWFVQRRLLGECLTDNLIIQKAREMEAEFGSMSNFKASRGWLWNWKKKYGIRLVTIYWEPADINEAVANNFAREFSQLLVQEDINDEDLYNMDESSLFWKLLPRKILVPKEERDKERKGKKDTVTVALCANANGTHKLPLLFIHKFANSRALKHCRNMLPVTYKNQRNACVNEGIFREWYNNDFKESVRQRQVQQHRTGKVLLLVDDFREHKLSENELDDGHFKLIFLPPNTSLLIQPMDHGVIAKCKKLFRHKLLSRVLQYDEGITQFYADYDIKDCIDLISAAWNEITPQDIYRSWTKILNRPLPCNNTITRENSTLSEQIERQHFETMSVEEVTEWISECEQTELIPEEAAIKEETVPPSPFPIEEEEVDRLLYNLENLSKTEPKIEPHAKAIIDYFNRKEET